MTKLTDRDFVLGASLNDLIHVVVTADTSQDSAGSSYKASMKQYSDIILSSVPKDVFVTSGVYQKSTDTATFTNNTGGTFTVTGWNSNLQRIITASSVLSDSDNNYTILINNNVSDITITIPSGLTYGFNVGFIQQGSGNVTISGSGTSIRTPIAGAFRIKGMNYNAYIEQIATSNDFHLIGNIKV